MPPRMAAGSIPNKRRAEPSGSGTRPPLVFKKSAKKARLDASTTAGAASTAIPSATNGSGATKGKDRQSTGKTSVSQAQPLKSAMKQTGRPRAEGDQQQQPGGKQMQKQAALKRPNRDAGLRSPASSSKSAATISKVEKSLASKNGASAARMTPAATTTWIQPPAPLPSFRIIVGSYERLLYGVQVMQAPTSKASDDLSLILSPIFQFPAHPSAIKALATAGSSSKFLVTAGQDELIKIWDLRRKREVGSLSGAELFGSPLSINFPLASHMLLTAEGGAILLYRTRDWALLHTFKGHTGRVNFISTHPSAKLALSGGQDGVLRAWDLTRGKSLGGTKMGMGHGGEMEALRWFGGEGKGHFFALLGRTVVRIFRKDMSEVARIGQGNLTGVRFNDIAVWDLSSLQDGAEQVRQEVQGKTLIFVAREDKKVGVYLFDRKIFDELDARATEKEDQSEGDDEDDEEEQRTLKEIGWLEGHASRVKSIVLQPLSRPLDDEAPESGPAPWRLTATTISSDGLVRIFDLAALVSSKAPSISSLVQEEPLLSIRPSAEYSTKGSRLTCLSVVGGDGSLLKQGQADLDEDEEEEDQDIFHPLSDVDTDPEDDAGGTAEEDEEAELARLEEILREAKREGIDLEELLRTGMGEDDDDDDDDEVEDGMDNDLEEEVEADGDSGSEEAA